MHEAALEGDKDPDWLSYTHSLNIIRRKLPQSGAFPPLRKISSFIVILLAKFLRKPLFQVEEKLITELLKDEKVNMTRK